MENAKKQAKSIYENKAWIYIVLAFAIGLIIMSFSRPVSEIQTVEVTKEVPVETIKEVEVVKTPDSCKKAIEIDNAIFLVVGEGLGSLDFDSVTEYINSVSDERTANVLDCMAS